MKAVSFNISCAWDEDGICGFSHRIGMIYERISAEKPDIIGFQEIAERILDVLEKLFPDYRFIGHGRSENYDGEGLYVATRKETCDLLSFDSFWLSETPQIPGSRYKNQSECPRICNVAKIKYKPTGEIIRIFNIHLDHISDEARVSGMKCVLDFVEKYKVNDPQEFMIMGDFNSEPGDGAIRLCNNFEGVEEKTSNIPYTYHDNGKIKMKIDYIYMTEKLAQRFKDNGVWEDNKHGIYLSDHYPLYVILKD